MANEVFPAVPSGVPFQLAAEAEANHAALGGGGGGAERRNSSNSLSDPTLTAELFSFFSMTLAKEKEETNPLQESCLFHRCRRLLLFLLCLRFLQIFRQRKGSRRGGRKYLGGGEGRGEGRGSYPTL